ncbi:pseudouridine synthase [Cytophagaceae bacterium ABcell3]|nr:pseudouridine synthase [Cytophagaceae bacterium ABcell3]
MSSFRYFKIYKPYRMLSQFTGGHGQQPVLSELGNFPKDVYPVGRLDADSEGLLLLTNNKKINSLLLNPKNKHERTYYAQVEGIATEKAIDILENRVSIRIEGQDYLTRPAKASLLEEPENLPPRHPPVRFRLNKPTSWLSLTLIEGKYRQVRKMTAAAGFPTLRLIRISIENMYLGSMQPGEVQELSEKEFLKQLNLTNKIHSARKSRSH